MAKKKMSRKSNVTSNNQQSQNQTAPVTNQKPGELSRQSSIEDHDSSEEKFQNLKSLNAMLLKQNVEKREQIESFSKAKDALEAELATSNAEKTQLREELRGSSDENIVLKVEKDVFMGFFDSRVEEMSVGVDRFVKEKSDGGSEIIDLKREANDLLRQLESERKELSRVCDERDSIKYAFDLQSEETNRLKETLAGMEVKATSLEEEVAKVKSENGRMVKERRKREELIERVNKEKTNLEKTLEEKIRESEELMRKMKDLAKEKVEIEIVKRDQKDYIVELEKKLEDLNETVQSLTREKDSLRDQVIGLEKKLDEVLEEAKATAEQINAFVKEKIIMKSEIERLVVEINSLEEQCLREKNGLVERIFNQEAEIFDLSKLVDEQKRVAAQLQNDFDYQTMSSEKLSCEVSRLKDALALVEVERDNAGKALDKLSILSDEQKCVSAQLQNAYDDQTKTSEKLSCEVSRLKDALALVEVERDNAGKALDELSKLADEQKNVATQLRNEQTKSSEKLRCEVSQLKDAVAVVEVQRDNAHKAVDEEKRNRLALKEKVVELEKMIKELNKIKAERGTLIKAKKEFENRSDSLRKEKSILQKEITELKNAMAVLKTELESARNNGRHNLTMLKSVSAQVCGVKNKKGEKGMDSHSMELEAIKKAFNNKESMVEEMKKEVENMKHSMEDEHKKKKRCWTLISSVTTLFLVASAAYAAATK